jgi:trimeric autotransporter adhesin
MMIDGFVWLVPLAVLAIVLLFACVGCTNDFDSLQVGGGTDTTPVPPAQVFTTPTEGAEGVEYPVPEGVSSLTAEAWGAGAGGSGPTGGSGGGYAKTTFDLTAGDQVFYHVGAGSAGVAADAASEAAGESWVSVNKNEAPGDGDNGCRALGAKDSGGGAAGTPGTGTIGDVNLMFMGGQGNVGQGNVGADGIGGSGGGGAGSTGDGGDGDAIDVGQGGVSPDGGYGGGGKPDAPGADGTQPGGGGGGVWETDSIGGNGAHGQVKFTW